MIDTLGTIPSIQVRLTRFLPILDREETKRRLIQCIHRAIYTKDDANRSKSSDLFGCRRASGRGRRWRHICTQRRGQFDYCPEIIILSCSRRRHHHHRFLRLSVERLRGHQTWCNRRVKRPISVQHTFIRLTSKMLADFSLSFLLTDETFVHREKYRRFWTDQTSSDDRRQVRASLSFSNWIFLSVHNQCLCVQLKLYWAYSWSFPSPTRKEPICETSVGRTTRTCTTSFSHHETQRDVSVVALVCHFLFVSSVYTHADTKTSSAYARLLSIERRATSGRLYLRLFAFHFDRIKKKEKNSKIFDLKIDRRRASGRQRERERECSMCMSVSRSRSLSFLLSFSSFFVHLTEQRQWLLFNRQWTGGVYVDLP